MIYKNTPERIRTSDLRIRNGTISESSSDSKSSINACEKNTCENPNQSTSEKPEIVNPFTEPLNKKNENDSDLSKLIETLAKLTKEERQAILAKLKS